MRLVGRRLHIAGSANRNTDVARIAQAHEIVRRLVRAALREGTTLVMQAGPEPRVDAADPSSSALVFDWTIAEEVQGCLGDGTAKVSAHGERLVFAVSSEKAEADMPLSRRALWHALLDSGAVRLEHIRPGSRSGATMRVLQAREGNVLVTLGGGAGVEHLAGLYAARGRPIVPLDAQLGASRNDGTLGGEGLARLALAEPTRFFRLRVPGVEAARLLTISTRGGESDPAEVADRLIALLADLEPPTAFFAVAAIGAS